MNYKNGKKQGSVLYLSHGGGPLPILGDPGHRKMVTFMKGLSSRFDIPDEILVISAHWEESLPTVIGQESPPLFYDYYGFPDEAYELTYPAPGNPALARDIQSLMKDAGIGAELSTKRGFDHGLFIPLKLMYPEAHIPVTQLSLINGLNPEEHIRLGKALNSLLERNILIIGSGFSFHNMREFSWDGRETLDKQNDEFQNWLIEICTKSEGQDEREESLLNWEEAPHARYCHPREEHLLPLHVCMGLAEDRAQLIFDDYVMGKRAVAFLWN